MDIEELTSMASKLASVKSKMLADIVAEAAVLVTNTLNMVILNTSQLRQRE
jgi:hypothetical protein